MNENVQKALAKLREVIDEVVERGERSCCGRGYDSCCGEPNLVFSDEDNEIFAILCECEARLHELLGKEGA